MNDLPKPDSLAPSDIHSLQLQHWYEGKLRLSMGFYYVFWMSCRCSDDLAGCWKNATNWWLVFPLQSDTTWLLCFSWVREILEFNYARHESLFALSGLVTTGVSRQSRLICPLCVTRRWTRSMVRFSLSRCCPQRSHYLGCAGDRYLTLCLFVGTVWRWRSTCQVVFDCR